MTKYFRVVVTKSVTENFYVEAESQDAVLSDKALDDRMVALTNESAGEAQYDWNIVPMEINKDHFDTMIKITDSEPMKVPFE